MMPDWKVIVLHSPEVVNAMVFPTGHVIVFTGILDLLDRDEDATAVILAHECSHVLCRFYISRSIGVC